MSNETNKNSTSAVASIAQYVFDKYVKNDMPPSSELESEAIHDQRKKDEIAEMLLHNQMNAHEGAVLFLNLDTDGTIKAIIERIRNAQPADILQTNFFSDQDFELLMSKALEVYHNDQLIEAMNLFTFISQLFPKQVQPFIAMATIIWKQSGVEEASEVYSHLIECLPNPLLMHYAADCFHAAGNTQKAKDTLERGLKLCNANPSFAPIAKEINDALAQL